MRAGEKGPIRKLAKSFQYACKDTCNWPPLVRHSLLLNGVTHFQVPSLLFLPTRYAY
jgi:hypothetical protein